MDQRDAEKFLRNLEETGKREAWSWTVSWKDNIYFRINDVDELLHSTKKAIKFFAANGFYRGRRDELSSAYADCFLRAYELVFDDLNITKETLLQRTSRLVDGYRGEVGLIGYEVNELDAKMIRSVFADFLPLLSDYEFNPVRYAVEETKNGNFESVFNRINDVDGLGTKLTSMFMRNVIIYFDLEGRLKEENYGLLFAVDTHVRQLARLAWPEARKKEDKELMNFVVQKARDLNISPAYLNVGFWLIHLKAPELIEMILGRPSELDP